MKKILSILIVITISYIYINKKKDSQKPPEMTTNKNADSTIPKTKKIDIHKKKNKVEVAQEKQNSKKITLTQKYKEIKNEYFQVPNKKLKVTVSKINESTIKINGQSTKVYHVLVKAKKNHGPSSSYEALVDPVTKQVYRTWNQTKFETKESFSIKAKGLEYHSPNSI